MLWIRRLSVSLNKNYIIRLPGNGDIRAEFTKTLIVGK